jgi:hypothetical protein
VLSYLGISMLIKQAINLCQCFWSGQARVSKRGREGHGDGLGGSSLETNVSDQLFGFVDRHIFEEASVRLVCVRVRSCFRSFQN